MNEPTKVYVATAYRWGWYNDHHYVVAASVDRDAVLAAAEDEPSDRGGKYGVEVVEYPSEETIAYFPSAYSEEAPKQNWRITAADDIGIAVLVAHEDGKALLPVPGDPGRLEMVDVTMPEWLEERVEHYVQIAKILCNTTPAATEEE
jgi:hypothetical protein